MGPVANRTAPSSVKQRLARSTKINIALLRLLRSPILIWCEVRIVLDEWDVVLERRREVESRANSATLPFTPRPLSLSLSLFLSLRVSRHICSSSSFFILSLVSPSNLLLFVAGNFQIEISSPGPSLHDEKFQFRCIRNGKSTAEEDTASVE